MAEDRYYEWLKERKKVILEIKDLNLRSSLMNIHNEYVEQYICKKKENDKKIN